MSEQPGLFDIDDYASEAAPMDDSDFEAPQRLRYISFGSGSSGNCAYIGTTECGVLIDAGIDNNRVLEELARNAIDPLTIHGILLTHDHSDHVRYAYALLRRFRHWHIFATPKAFNGLLRRHSISRRISDYHQPIYKEFPFKIGPLTVTAFETSHDGTDNVGFAIDFADTHFVVATDTGTISSRTDYYVRRANYLMIESNYDAEMLRTGPYPARLKARISSTSGHLDNRDSARYCASVAKGGLLRGVFLCHLSHINNTPQKAYETYADELQTAEIPFTTTQDADAHDKMLLQVLPREQASTFTVLY